MKLLELKRVPGKDNATGVFARPPHCLFVLITFCFNIADKNDNPFILIGDRLHPSWARNGAWLENIWTCFRRWLWWLVLWISRPAIWHTLYWWYTNYYTGWPPKKWNSQFWTLLLSTVILSTLLDRASSPHNNNTKIIKFGWELFILWVIFLWTVIFGICH